MKPDCWVKSGGKEGQGPQLKKGKSKTNSAKTDSGNAVAEMPEKTPDGVWMAVALDASDNDLDIDDDKQSDLLSECPDLEINDDEQSDWLSECSEASIWVDEDAEDDVCTSVDITMLAASGIPGGDIVKLFDSSATRHMTLHKHLLENYRQISPKSINAANKHTFNAIGQGDVCITIPNGESGTTFILKDVLYSPDIAVTFISVSRIDVAGYTTTFGGGACII